MTLLFYKKYLTISITRTPEGKKGRTVKQSSSDEETSSSSEEIKDDPEALKRRVDDVLASIAEGATRKGLTSEEAAVRLLPVPFLTPSISISLVLALLDS